MAEDILVRQAGNQGMVAGAEWFGHGLEWRGGPVGAKARSGENLAVSSWLSIWGIGSKGVPVGQ